MAREFFSIFAILAPSLGVLVVLLQGMRLLPLVSTAQVGVVDIVEVMGLLFVPLLVLALPAAAVFSILILATRLDSDGELIALGSVGVSPLRIVAAPLVLCAVISCFSGGIALFAEPSAYERLHDRFGRLLIRSALGKIRPGVVVEPLPGLTVYAEERSGSQLSGVFLEDRREKQPVRIIASKVQVTAVEGRPAALLVIERGSVHKLHADGTLTRATFSKLRAPLDLSGAVEELSSLVPSHLKNDPWELADQASSRGSETQKASFLLHRRLSVAASAMGLCVLAFVVGFGRRSVSKPWVIPVGALLILSFHLCFRLCEACVEDGLIMSWLGAWLPTLLCWALFVFFILFWLLRRGSKVWFRKN